LGGGGLFLLESGGPTGRQSRWSLLGSHPIARFASHGGENRFHWHSQGQSHRWREEPLAALRRVLALFPPAHVPSGIPFAGGAVGLFSYELGRRLLPLRPLAEDDLALPEISLYFYDRCLLFDREERRLIAAAYARGEDDERAHAEAAAHAELLAEETLRRLDEAASGKASALPRAATLPAADPEPPPVSATLSRLAYMDAVRRCRREILDGNAYELCLTTRFEAPYPGDAVALYRELRRSNPAPFAALLRHPEATLVGSSPERFLHVDAGGRVEARPIKGTRPRGADPATDAALRAELLRSGKDRAENVMIVDLLRNDLHKVCEPGTVSVPELCALEEHPSVFQLVSTISGRLREDRDRLDLIAAGFPGGSMTGAPKIAAMNLLEEMEPKVRGYYSGTLGYLGFDGAMDLSIVIRSVQLIGRRALVGAGGAVVFDSDPEMEWAEAWHKAEAPLAALARAGSGAASARAMAVGAVGN